MPDSRQLENTPDERDFALLDGDRYTFAVLGRIMRIDCRLILTDHSRLIICHSADPYPVWIWTPDGLSDEEKAFAWETVSASCPVTSYSYNLKYELAEYFAARAEAEGISAGITLNMFAYDCPSPVEPSPADGNIYKCAAEDTDETARIIKMFHEELNVDRTGDEGYRAQAEELIGRGCLYLWKTPEGVTAASCAYNISGDGLGSINCVYTMPGLRRRHYAENLVYAVTRLVADAGAMPILYTNADYIASNACYEKIGYVMRGKLCTFGMMGEE